MIHYIYLKSGDPMNTTYMKSLAFLLIILSVITSLQAILYTWGRTLLNAGTFGGASDVLDVITGGHLLSVPFFCLLAFMGSVMAFLREDYSLSSLLACVPIISFLLWVLN
jgi:amino acid permease